jgi:cell division protein FtsQ
MRHVLYIFAFVILFSGLAFLADRAGVFLIRDVHIEIHGATADQSFYGRKRALLQAQLEQFRGVALWKIQIGAISDQIFQHDWVGDVEIFRHFPNQLEIHVTPKSIALIYQNSHGDLLPVANDGSLLSLARSSEIPDVPILRGKIFGDRLDLRRKAIDLISQLPLVGKLTANSVSEVSYQERDGFQLLLHHSNAKVQMGHEDFKKKSSRVAQVISYLDAHDIEGRSIDASYARKVLVRMKKAPSTP